jgi:hypothetical protein
MEVLAARAFFAANESTTCRGMLEMDYRAAAIGSAGYSARSAARALQEARRRWPDARAVRKE